VVAGDEGAAEGCGGEAAAAAGVEDLALSAEHDGQDSGVAGELSCGFGGELFAGVEVGPAEAGPAGVRPVDAGPVGVGLVGVGLVEAGPVGVGLVGAGLVGVVEAGLQGVEGDGDGDLGWFAAVVG
jgi:hypothetical protein